MKLAKAIVMVVLALGSLAGSARGDEAQRQPGKDGRDALTIQIQFTNRCAAAQTPAQYIAGEQAPVGIRIAGLQADGEGKIDVISRAELVDANGRTIKPLPSERFHQGLGLGGGELNYGRGLTLPADAVGKHVLRVTVTDQVSGCQAIEQIELAIAGSSTFGLINLGTYLDAKGEVESNVVPVGRTMFVIFAVNGCAEREGQMQVDCEGWLTDLKGQPLASEPVRVSVKPESSIYGTTGQARVGMYMHLNRSGEFLFKLKVKDAIGGKEAEQVIPILVAGLSPVPVEVTAAIHGDVKR